MKAIVTGATGGLGHNLVTYLLEKNIEVLAFGRNEAIAKRLGVPYRCFDLSDEKATLEAFESADLLFHCAALSSPWGAYDDFYKANVKATQNVLTAMQHYKIPQLIHVSTPSIYFNFTPQLQVKEDFLPQKFVNHYAQTKYEAEQLVIKSDIHAVIIRPRGIFGEYDTVLVPRLEKVAREGALPLAKNRECLVDVTYVGNVVHALYLAATTPLQDNEIFNITNDEPLPIKQVFEMVMETIEVKVHFKSLPYPLLMGVATLLEFVAKLKIGGEPKITRYGVGVITTSQTLDISHAKQLLGYTPLYTIEEGLSRYGRWKHKNI